VRYARLKIGLHECDYRDYAEAEFGVEPESPSRKPSASSAGNGQKRRVHQVSLDSWVPARRVVSIRTFSERSSQESGWVDGTDEMHYDMEDTSTSSSRPKGIILFRRRSSMSFIREPGLHSNFSRVEVATPTLRYHDSVVRLRAGVLEPVISFIFRSTVHQFIRWRRASTSILLAARGSSVAPTRSGYCAHGEDGYLHTHIVRTSATRSSRSSHAEPLSSLRAQRPPVSGVLEFDNNQNAAAKISPMSRIPCQIRCRRASIQTAINKGKEEAVEACQLQAAKHHQDSRCVRPSEDLLGDGAELERYGTSTAPGLCSNVYVVNRPKWPSMSF